MSFTSGSPYNTDSIHTIDYFVPIYLNSDPNSDNQIAISDQYEINDDTEFWHQDYDFSETDRDYFVSNQAYEHCLAVRQAVQGSLDSDTLEGASPTIPETFVFAARCDARTYNEALAHYESGIEAARNLFRPLYCECIRAALDITAASYAADIRDNKPLPDRTKQFFTSVAAVAVVRCIAGRAEMLARLHRWREAADAWAPIAQMGLERWCDPVARVGECLLTSGEIELAKLIVTSAGVDGGGVALAYLNLLFTAMTAPGTVISDSIIKQACQVFNKNCFVPAYLCKKMSLIPFSLPVVADETRRHAAAVVAARQSHLWWALPGETALPADPEPALCHVGASVASGIVRGAGGDGEAARAAAEGAAAQVLRVRAATCVFRAMDVYRFSPVTFLEHLFSIYVTRFLCLAVDDSKTREPTAIPVSSQAARLLSELVVFSGGSSSTLLRLLRSPVGMTPLHYMVMHNQLASVENLIYLVRMVSKMCDNSTSAFSADFLDARLSDELGNLTALHIAAIYGNDRMMYLLLREGASPWVPAAEGRLPLHLAACYSEHECVTLLLDSCKDDRERYVMANWVGMPPLEAADGTAAAPPLQSAISSRIPFCHYSNRQSPCLRCAAAAVGVLPYAHAPPGSDAQVPGEYYKRFMNPPTHIQPPENKHITADFGKTVTLLLAAGAEPLWTLPSAPPDTPPTSALTVACNMLNSDAIFALLTWARSHLGVGVDGQSVLRQWVNSQDSKGRTPLMRVVRVFLGSIARRRDIIRETGPVRRYPTAAENEIWRNDPGAALAEYFLGLDCGVETPNVTAADLKQFLGQQVQDVSRVQAALEIAMTQAAQPGGNDRRATLARDLLVRIAHPYASMPAASSYSVFLTEGYKAAKVLVDFNANPHQPDQSGNTPLEQVRNCIATERILADGNPDTPQLLVTKEDVALPAPPDYDEEAWHDQQQLRLAFDEGVVENIVRLYKLLNINEQPSAELCAYCQRASPAYVCSGCKEARYCSTACQTADWSRHRSKCRESQNQNQR